MTPRFLELDEVIGLHLDQLVRYGGAPGVRDLGLLESAVEMPRASFGGEYLHAIVPEMATAYLFHLARNHAFVDGNERVAAAAMIMFLYLNDHDLACDEDALVALVLRVASGEATKADAAVWLAARLR